MYPVDLAQGLRDIQAMVESVSSDNPGALDRMKSAIESLCVLLAEHLCDPLDDMSE